MAGSRESSINGQRPDATVSKDSWGQMGQFLSASLNRMGPSGAVFEHVRLTRTGAGTVICDCQNMLSTNDSYTWI
jgi:hypothetical protein